MIMDNYIDLIVDDVYDVIRKGKHWPTQFRDTDKKQLLQNMISYFVSKEQFEKCAYLQVLLDEIDNK